MRCHLNIQNPDYEHIESKQISVKSYTNLDGALLSHKHYSIKVKHGNSSTYVNLNSLGKHLIDAAKDAVNFQYIDKESTQYINRKLQACKIELKQKNGSINEQELNTIYTRLINDFKEVKSFVKTIGQSYLSTTN